jgi:small GTP-binding protein
MHSSPKIISQKICLIGDFGVGKTSLIRQFVDRQFSDTYLSTVGVKISRKVVSILDSLDNLPKKIKQIQLIVWDIEGSTRFQAIAPSYLQGAKGALIVADVTRDSSIENLKTHVQLFQSINPKSSLLIALNKVDLLENNVRNNLIKSISVQFSDLKISIHLTSAKTGEGVNDIFQTLASHMLPT